MVGYSGQIKAKHKREHFDFLNIQFDGYRVSWGWVSTLHREAFLSAYILTFLCYTMRILPDLDTLSAFTSLDLLNSSSDCYDTRKPDPALSHTSVILSSALSPCCTTIHMQCQMQSAYDLEIRPTIKSLGPTNPCHLRSIVPRKTPIKGCMGLEKVGCPFPSLSFFLFPFSPSDLYSFTRSPISYLLYLSLIHI